MDENIKQESQQQSIPTVEDYQKVNQQLSEAQNRLAVAQNQATVYKLAHQQGYNPEVLAKLTEGLTIEVSKKGELLVEGQLLSEYASSHWQAFKTSLFPQQQSSTTLLSSGSPMGQPQKEKSVAQKYIEKWYPIPSYLRRNS